MQSILLTMCYFNFTYKENYKKQKMFTVKMDKQNAFHFKQLLWMFCNTP